MAPDQAVADSDEDLQKRVAFYSIVTEAFVASGMEKDRTFVTIAAGGIGLLVTLLTTDNSTHSRLELWCFALAALFFTLAIGLGIWVFSRNKPYLLKVHKEGIEARDCVLECLDLGLAVCFGLGVVFTAISAAVAVAGL